MMPARTAVCTAAVQQQVHPTASSQQPAGRTGLVDIHFSNISRTKCAVELYSYRGNTQTFCDAFLHSCSFCGIRYTGLTEYSILPGTLRYLVYVYFTYLSASLSKSHTILYQVPGISYVRARRDDPRGGYLHLCTAPDPPGIMPGQHTHTSEAAAAWVAVATAPTS